MTVELNSLFQAFAERFYKENHLSDMTYALCQSDEAFKQFFLDFFFGCNKINVYRNKVELIRELAFDEGRPDFSIRVGDNDIYLIEVKIWDGKHHFSDYMDILLNEYKNKADAKGHLGYIANYMININDLSEADKEAYTIVCENGRTVRTWQDFVGRLENYQGFNDPIIKGYIHYVKNICPFDDFELPKEYCIKMSDFKEIAHFINSIEQKIQEMKGKGILSPYYSTKKFSSKRWMGHYFKLDNYNKGKTAWGWMGANYTQDGAVVFVEFENQDEWGKPVCEQFSNLSFQGDLCFYLKDKKIEWNVFFEQVIEFIMGKGNITCPTTVCYTVDEAAKFKTLLTMKSLPWLLDKFFLSLVNKQLSDNNLIETSDKWSISSSDFEHNDSEQQDSHCGRYYVLKYQGQKVIEFWIGVLFNNSLKTKTGDNYSLKPKLFFDMSKQDYDYACLHFLEDTTEWYELQEWRRVVCELSSENEMGDKFCDIVTKAGEILETIIQGYGHDNK